MINFLYMDLRKEEWQESLYNGVNPRD